MLNFLNRFFIIIPAAAALAAAAITAGITGKNLRISENLKKELEQTITAFNGGNYSALTAEAWKAFNFDGDVYDNDRNVVEIKERVAFISKLFDRITDEEYAKRSAWGAWYRLSSTAARIEEMDDMLKAKVFEELYPSIKNLLTEIIVGNANTVIKDGMSVIGVSAKTYETVNIISYNEYFENLKRETEELYATLKNYDKELTAASASAENELTIEFESSATDVQKASIMKKVYDEIAANSSAYAASVAVTWAGSYVEARKALINVDRQQYSNLMYDRLPDADRSKYISDIFAVFNAAVELTINKYANVTETVLLGDAKTNFNSLIEEYVSAHVSAVESARSTYEYEINYIKAWNKYFSIAENAGKTKEDFENDMSALDGGIEEYLGSEYTSVPYTVPTYSADASTATTIKDLKTLWDSAVAADKQIRKDALKFKYDTYAYNNDAGITLAEYNAGIKAVDNENYSERNYVMYAYLNRYGDLVRKPGETEYGFYNRKIVGLRVLENDAKINEASRNVIIENSGCSRITRPLSTERRFLRRYIISVSTNGTLPTLLSSGTETIFTRYTTIPRLRCSTLSSRQVISLRSSAEPPQKSNTTTIWRSSTN